MVLKAQQVTVLLIGSPEGGVFFLECLAESRVIQLLRQAYLMTAIIVQINS